MSQYILEKESNYVSLYSEPFGLKHYVFLRNTADSKRFLLAKFLNQSPETILRAEFEVIQINKQGKEIRKANYLLDDVSIRPFQEAVTYEKIEIDPECTQVKARLLTAQSHGKRWENRAWKELVVRGPAKTPEPKYQMTFPRKDRSFFPFYIPLILLILFVILVGELFKWLN
jgi:hypothetical protein